MAEAWEAKNAGHNGQSGQAFLARRNRQAQSDFYSLSNYNHGPP